MANGRVRVGRDKPLLIGVEYYGTGVRNANINEMDKPFCCNVPNTIFAAG